MLALADAAPLAAEGGSNALVSFLPFIVLIAVFYFLLIRPQRNRQKRTQQMQSALIPGQRILTTAAMYATVVAIDDDGVVLEIAPGVEARFNRAAIAQVLTPEEEETPDIPDTPESLTADTDISDVTDDTDDEPASSDAKDRTDEPSDADDTKEPSDNKKKN